MIAAGAANAKTRFSVDGLLAAAPLRYIGDRSYAFYLWHWPVLVIAAQYAGHSLSVATDLQLLAGAFVLSMVSYRLIENPIRNAQFLRRSESALVWVFSTLLVLAFASTYISSISNREIGARVAAARLPAPELALARPPVGAAQQPSAGSSSASAPVSQVLPAVIRAAGSRGAKRGIPSGLNPPVGQLLQDRLYIPSTCEAHGTETTETICRLGAASSARTMVVIGDSHADMWLPAILNLARRDAWSVVPLIKSGCSPASWVGSSGTSDCHAWFSWITRRGAMLRPDVALITGYDSYVGAGQDPTVGDGITAAVRAMTKPAKHVIVMGDVPQRHQQPVDCLLASHATIAGCSVALDPGEAEITSQVAQLAKNDGAGFIDPTGWFCYDGGCPLVVSNIITYRDDSHVSQTYALALSAAFRSAFDGIVSPRRG